VAFVLVKRRPRGISHSSSELVWVSSSRGRQGPRFIELPLDQTLAALEHISEDTAALMRRLDELLKA
jgi:hypothetical protein